MEPIKGWVLATKDDDGKWYVCWHEIFDSRVAADGFAKNNKWRSPWKATRGLLTVVK